MSLITKEEKEFFRTCATEVADVMVKHTNAVDCLAALKKWREENVWICPVNVLNDFNRAIEIVERTCQDELDPARAKRIKELVQVIDSLTPGIRLICVMAGGNAQRILPMLKMHNEVNTLHLDMDMVPADQLESALRLQKDFPVAIKAIEEILSLK